jgi:hypothetical protein
MELLNEIHFGLPIAISLLFLWVYVIWARNHAFGLFLDKQVKKGKAWVYLPIGWTPKTRALKALVLKLLLFCSITFGSLSLSLIIGAQKELGLGLVVTYAITVLILGKISIQHRFNQQENAYYSIQDAIISESEREGKRISDTELQNLASYQFQNALRTADSNKRLLKELDERSAAR